MLVNVTCFDGKITVISSSLQISPHKVNDLQFFQCLEFLVPVPRLLTTSRQRCRDKQRVNGSYSDRCGDSSERVREEVDKIPAVPLTNSSGLEPNVA